MSWLEDRVLTHVYRRKDGDEVCVELPAGEDRPDKIKGYHFVETLPFKVNLTFRIQFERNGLVAYKYDQGDGRPRVVSATRENFEKSYGNTGADRLRELKKQGRLGELSKSITTKGYRETYKKVKGAK